jgi:fructose-1,6-bisphosphatase I
VFLYPNNEKSPEGKLRIAYECNPIAFLAEQANGAASNGEKRILDIVPEILHQRSPLYVGSKNMVSKIEKFLQEEEHSSARPVFSEHLSI